MPPFVHLHVHSEYSPMQGVSPLQALCDAVRAHGARTLALTDTNGFYTAVRFLTVARQARLRPILGAELTTESHRAVLLAKTPEGYANLCRLLSARHSDPGFSFIDAVARHRDGVIVLSDDEPALAAWANDSREDLYVELTPGPAMHQTLLFSRRAHLPPVATNRVHFVRPDEFSVHRLLRAIALNTTLSRLPASACCRPTHWLMPPERMARQFPHCPEAIEHTSHIAETCHTDWRFGETIFPAFRQLSSEAAFTLLREHTYAGATKRYGEVSPTIRARIEHELAIIQDKRFADYFLVVQEIVRQAPRTCGRGSVAASIVSYCLEITHVDPLRHNLFFERFLNPGRKDPPDIDIDFPWDERDDILDWVFTRYGASQAAMVANQNTLGIRAAIREVAKVYGIPATEIGRVSSLILRRQHFVTFDRPPTADVWAQRVSRSLALREPWPDILRAAVRVEGRLRHLSLHCGGVVIVPDEIRRYVPVEIAAKGVPVIQWEKEQTEEAGLVKIDLLGNRSLAVIRDALRAVADNTGRTIEYAAWNPLTDSATQELIRQGNTMGCFYIESPATRSLLRKLWGGMPPDRKARLDVFEYLVMVSSLVRPAAIRFVDEFVRRAQGAPYRPWHPRLATILDETHGIMVYQEDVTKVAMALADFSVEDADQLRKVLSKKHKEKQLRDYRDQFCRGAAKNGADPDTIVQIWQMILSFAGYSFCKPHSASYAQVSFKSAYLRAHYPAEFMAAVISNQGGYYSAYAYMSESRRMGLTIAPPDVNASEWAYTGCDRTIRIGLMQIKSFPETVGKKIVEERTANGVYHSFQDLLARVPMETRHARSLVRSGCCDSIAGELTRPALLWRLYAGARAGSVNLPVPDDYPLRRKLAHEMETLGLLFSRHPLELYHPQLRRIDWVPASAMPAYVGRRITMVGVLVTEKAVETKDGLLMEFATFEDTTALYDATLFPDVYRRSCHLLATDRAYLLRGLVEEQFGVATFTVATLYLLSPESTDKHEATNFEGTGPWYAEA
ncbi:DNA-directed DNA polymerase [Nitrospira sp.]|nr:DNA-directed DNA polymerase [Nitrospira sp.]